MNRNLTLLTALAACLVSAPFALSQAAAAPAAPAAAINAKIGLVAFEQVVTATNEGQTILLGIQKKYEPREKELEKLNAEVESMKKSLQAAPATLPDDERASRLRAIDTKEKQLNRDAQEFKENENADAGEALQKLAAKVEATMRTYAQTNGYTLLLDASPQTSNILWAVDSTNISAAIVDAYNKASGVAAPPPQAPSAPSASHATPKPAAPSH
jgi:outer membrane protein